MQELRPAYFTKWASQIRLALAFSVMRSPVIDRNTAINYKTCSALIKPTLNNVWLPTLFNALNDIFSIVEPELARNQV